MQTFTELAGVHFSERSVCDSSDHANGIAIPLAGIESCMFRRGRFAAHPRAQLIVGIGMAASVLLLPVVISRTIFASAPISVRTIGILLFLSTIGAWLLLDLRRVGYFLVLRYQGETRRIAFDRDLTDAEIEFVATFFASLGSDRFVDKTIREEKRQAQPGATDNPDDAKHVREDH